MLRVLRNKQRVVHQREEQTFLIPKLPLCEAELRQGFHCFNGPLSFQF